MTGTVPVEADYVGAFKVLMEKRRINGSVIEEFISLWRSLQPNPARLPCPICYAVGGWGKLGAPELKGAVFQVKCMRCKTSISIASAKPERTESARAFSDATPPTPTGNVRWEVIFSAGPAKGSWTWRLMRIDGSIEQTSEAKLTFGEAIRDAMKKGFRPRQDFWVIKRQNWITCFDHGRIVSTDPTGEVFQTTSRQSPSRISSP
jgi:hypothetical protein